MQGVSVNRSEGGENENLNASPRVWICQTNDRFFWKSNRPGFGAGRLF